MVKEGLVSGIKSRKPECAGGQGQTKNPVVSMMIVICWNQFLYTTSRKLLIMLPWT